jgi:excisionase family DNA binding protein
MQAYATTGRLILNEPLPTFAATSAAQSPTGTGRDAALIDQLLGRLADLVVDRLMERAEGSANQLDDDWLDARTAATYLGMHRDTLRKLAAQRAVPVHQDGPGCKLYFRREELDDWRRSSQAPRSRLRVVS